MTADDGLNGKATANFTIYFYNYPPQLITKNNNTSGGEEEGDILLNIHIGKQLDYIFPSFSDADGDILTYQATTITKSEVVQVEWWNFDP